MRQIFKLAFRNLFRNSRRTFLTTLLIALSLAALMFTDALILGMSRVMINAATHIWSGEVQVHKEGFTSKMDQELFIENPQASIAILQHSPEVLVYSTRTVATGMLSSSQNLSGAQIYGIKPHDEIQLSKLSHAMIKGEMLNPERKRDILIGKKMAELLEANLGERLVLTLSENDSGELSQELFRLSGIFEFGIRELDESIAIINLDRAQDMLNIGKGVHEIAVRLKNPLTAHNKDFPLLQKLTKDSNVAESWPSFNNEIAAIIEMSRFSIWIMGGILFSLAALGVINSMFMSIYERIYEFGVIRAIGTSAGQLFSIVMCEAFVIAIFSIILGCLIGGALNYTLSQTGLYMGPVEFSGISFSEPIKTVVSLNQFIKYPLWILLITLIASSYPARFAMRIVPSEALRRAL